MILNRFGAHGRPSFLPLDIPKGNVAGLADGLLFALGGDDGAVLDVAANFKLCHVAFPGALKGSPLPYTPR